MNILQLRLDSTKDKHSVYDTLAALLVSGDATGIQTKKHLILNVGITIPSIDTPAYLMIFNLFSKAGQRGYSAIQIIKHGKTDSGERIDSERS